jgi:hypothetical protein
LLLLLDLDYEKKIYVFVDRLRFERWRKFKFEIDVIQLEQIEKIKLMLLNLLVLSEIEMSCCLMEG